MSDTKAINNLRDTADRERDDAADQVERIGKGLWQILATAVVAAESCPGEERLISRVQTATAALTLWSAVVDGDRNRTESTR